VKIFDGELSQDQIEAGLAVMRGEFTGSKVMTALGNAGVKNVVPGAEVLINREIKAGRIIRITRGIYRQT
jgi:hypothetical protein